MNIDKSDLMDGNKRCMAKSKQSGKRCKRYPTKGMKVCRMHGGVLGTSKAREARRIAAIRHGLYTKEALQEKKESLNLIKVCREGVAQTDS